MFHCVDRWEKHPNIRIGQSYRMMAPSPRPLGYDDRFARPEPHGTFDIVGFLAADEHTRCSRGHAHLALVRYRADGAVKPLALWMIEMLPEVYH
jgi:hypothetical protein